MPALQSPSRSRAGGGRCSSLCASLPPPPITPNFCEMKTKSVSVGMCNGSVVALAAEPWLGAEPPSLLLGAPLTGPPLRGSCIFNPGLREPCAPGAGQAYSTTHSLLINLTACY